MVGKGKSVAHGATLVDYVMRKEKAQIIRQNLLGNLDDADTIFMQMKMLHLNTRNLRKANHKVKNPYMEFEISPDVAESRGWNLADFRNLLDEFIAELNKVDLSKITKRKSSASFDLRKVQYVAAVHYDSKSRIPHIHIAANRIGADGQLLDDHKLADRILAAVHAVNVNRGWKMPEDIHKENVESICDSCMDALRKMPFFNWYLYGRYLHDAGLDLKLKRDSSGKAVSYVIMKGNSKYRASELGTGRSLTVKNIEKTWYKLHLDIEREESRKHLQERLEAQKSQELSSSARQSEESRHSDKVDTPVKEPRYSATYEVDNRKYSVNVPQIVYDYFKNNCEVPEDNTDASVEDVIKVSLLLFAGYIDAATTVAESSGGGGGSNDLPKKKDEDDLEWARICRMAAQRMCKPAIRISRGRH